MFQMKASWILTLKSSPYPFILLNYSLAVKTGASSLQGRRPSMHFSASRVDLLALFVCLCAVIPIGETRYTLSQT